MNENESKVVPDPDINAEHAGADGLLTRAGEPQPNDRLLRRGGGYHRLLRLGRVPRERVKLAGFSEAGVRRVRQVDPS